MMTLGATTLLGGGHHATKQLVSAPAVAMERALSVASFPSSFPYDASEAGSSDPPFRPARPSWSVLGTIPRVHSVAAAVPSIDLAAYMCDSLPEVTATAHFSDSALSVVDAAKGVRVQTPAALRQASVERLRLVVYYVDNPASFTRNYGAHGDPTVVIVFNSGPRAAVLERAYVIYAFEYFRFSPVKCSLRAVPLGDYDASLDDDPESGSAFLDAPFDQAVHRVSDCFHPSLLQAGAGSVLYCLEVVPYQYVLWPDDEDPMETMGMESAVDVELNKDVSFLCCGDLLCFAFDVGARVNKRVPFPLPVRVLAPLRSLAHCGRFEGAQDSTSTDSHVSKYKCGRTSTTSLPASWCLSPAAEHLEDPGPHGAAISLVMHCDLLHDVGFCTASSKRLSRLLLHASGSVVVGLSSHQELGVDSGARDLNAGALCLLGAFGRQWLSSFSFQELTEGMEVCNVKNMIQEEAICQEMPALPQAYG
jgi:hypothetical protein